MHYMQRLARLLSVNELQSPVRPRACVCVCVKIPDKFAFCCFYALISPEGEKINSSKMKLVSLNRGRGHEEGKKKVLYVRPQV